MVSTLVKRNTHYYCSNCMMRQLQLNPNCYFCGNSFSNWESVMIEEFKEDEENVRRTDADSHGMEQK